MNYKENKNRRMFNIDFDGILTTGEYTDDPGPEMAIINRVKELYMKGHIIIIWTARQWDTAPFLVAWLTKYSIPFHGIVMAKGGSDHYLDEISNNCFVCGTWYKISFYNSFKMIR